MRKIEIRLATLPGRTAARENIPLRYMSHPGYDTPKRPGGRLSPSAWVDDQSGIHEPATIWAQSLEISRQRGSLILMGQLGPEPFPFDTL